MAAPERMTDDFTALHGHTYRCEGTQDFTITLPSIEGNASEMLGISITNASQAVVYLRVLTAEEREDARDRAIHVADELRHEGR